MARVKKANQDRMEMVLKKRGISTYRLKEYLKKTGKEEMLEDDIIDYYRFAGEDRIETYSPPKTSEDWDAYYGY